MSGKYNLPSELTFFDKYGNLILKALLTLLFATSIIGYFYLRWAIKPKDVTDPLYEGKYYSLLALHHAKVRPAESDSPLTIKVHPQSVLTVTTPVTVVVRELNPEYTTLEGEFQRTFYLPSDRGTLITQFDVQDPIRSPDQVSFSVTVFFGKREPLEREVEIQVANLSTERVALLSAIITGFLSVWQWIGKELSTAIADTLKSSELVK
jgi:hypothetical protein